MCRYVDTDAPIAFIAQEIPPGLGAVSQDFVQIYEKYYFAHLNIYI